MTFTDITFVSDDVLRLVDFYEKLFNVSAAERGEIHSALNIGGLRLTIDRTPISDNSVFGYATGKSSDNTLLCFDVDDADAEHRRVSSLGAVTLNEPTTHPWGARSFQFRDPDGNIINFRSYQKEISR
jgi:predicted enzyme related to lactoylglutathione lyase